MANAWGTSFGVAWGNSWGSGAVAATAGGAFADLFASPAPRPLVRPYVPEILPPSRPPKRLRVVSVAEAPALVTGECTWRARHTVKPAAPPAPIAPPKLQPAPRRVKRAAPVVVPVAVAPPPLRVRCEAVVRVPTRIRGLSEVAWTDHAIARRSVEELMFGLLMSEALND